MTLRKILLILYNAVQAVLWSLALISIANSAAKSKIRVWAASHALVQLAQGLAILEPLLAALGIVKSNPMTALIQWAGRSNVLFGALQYAPTVRRLPTLTWLFGAWAASEVIRYPFLVAQLVASEAPRWLVVLRYSAFIILYPIGFYGEAALLYRALPALRKAKVGMISMPNRFNFAISYADFIVLILISYVYFAPVMYLHMLKQRRVKLSPEAPTPSSSKKTL